MTRIEDTELNFTAFLIMLSTLKKVQTPDRFTPIIEDNKLSIVETTPEIKAEQFSPDLNFLEKLFIQLDLGKYNPLILTGEDEEYLKKCSHACYYVYNEPPTVKQFDPFNVFHTIHFKDVSALTFEQAFIQHFCEMFRIEYSISIPFINCQKNIETKKQTLNNRFFKTVVFTEENNTIQISFESETLILKHSLDALFMIKDLLFARGIDTSSIPESSVFAIPQNTQVIFPFNSQYGQLITIIFRNDNIKLEIKKNIT